MHTPLQNLMKQLAQISKSHAGCVEVAPAANDDLSTLELKLKTDNGTYLFGLRFHDATLLLDGHILIWSKKPIFHPNIDTESVCCNLLDDEWERGTSLDAVIASLFCLLENPNFSSPLNDDWWYSMYPEEDQDGEYDGANFARDLKAFNLKHDTQ
jgi:hypothetical protein